jgi:hypothetical protein
VIISQISPQQQPASLLPQKVTLKKKRIQENFIKLRMDLQLCQLDTNQKREDCSSLFQYWVSKIYNSKTR